MYFLQLILLFLLFVAGCSGQPVTLNVSAAASLTDAIKEINRLYSDANPSVAVIANFGSSGALQRQIENGAPADVFLSAASAQMDALQKQHLIVEGSRKDLLINKVVLIVPSDSTRGIADFKDLTCDKAGKIAVGDPKSVPAGMYAQQVFDKLEIYNAVKPKLVLAGDVRQVLAYVESGNVDAGVVYLTDTRISGKVRIVAGAPDDINAKIVYPVAVIKGSKNIEAAAGYEDFLFSLQAKTVFEKYGFMVIGR